MPAGTERPYLMSWGTIFLMISILAGFSEALAGSLAISILVGDILANAVSVSKSTTGVVARESKPQPGKGKVKK